MKKTRWIINNTFTKDWVRWADCVCSCGTKRIVKYSDIKSNRSKSCGCLLKEKNSKRLKKHGMYGTDIYRKWISMNARCKNKRDTSYKNYGGRGIIVCYRWRDSFENFYKDMGASYKKHVDKHCKKQTTIDRINNDGDYKPSNCRWATYKQQGKNKRNNVFVTIDGERMIMSDYCEKIGIKQTTIIERLKRGVDFNEAIKKNRQQ